MQSTTATKNYNNCMVEVGEWAYSLPSGNEAQKAQQAYQTLYGTYLAIQGGMVTRTVRTTSTTTQQQRPRQQRQRQRTGAAAARGRVRTVQGQLGQVDAKVLSQIVANANINTEALRKRPSLRTMTANIVGTCISRLLKGGYITGTAKVGPFSATPTGIAAVQKQPTSIGQARQQRQQRAGRRAATTPTTAQEQAAATG